MEPEHSNAPRAQIPPADPDPPAESLTGLGDRALVGRAELLTGPGVRALVGHAESLTRPVPAKGWLQQADALRAAPGAAGMVTALLERWCVAGGPVSDDSDMLLRGLIWFAARDPGDETTGLLARVAVAAGTAPVRASTQVCAPKAATAAVTILADRPGDVSVRALARLSLAGRSKPLLSRVRAALDRLGTSPGEALELAVDDHGLGVDGRRSWHLPGSDIATVEIEDGKAHLRVTRDGRPLKRVPADVDVTDARALVKEINKALGAERDRIESLLSEDRSWTYADWSTRYLDHPITGAVARRLIWQTSPDGRSWRAGIPRRGPDGGWTLADELGGVVGPAEARVRLWHPALAAPDEVVRWRDHIGAAEVRQPFKQAFREVYPLTPAEVASRMSSQRFAAHILRYRQANALMRTRGWAATYLGAWDQGHRTEAAKELGGGEWRAMLVHEVAGEVAAPHYQVAHCVTGEVRFTRRDGRAWQDVPLTEVPPLVFSEAMRDVDLFVGVTSIAADEAWQERGTERFPAYRQSAGFGELTATAEVRRDVLARLLPRLAIGPRCELAGRFLRVRGNRGTYRIHLGSANILIEPNDAYLCIVPDRRRKPAVTLPFDDDRVLSLILSKAILLAADDTITDPAIVAQLSARQPATAVPPDSTTAGPGRSSDSDGAGARTRVGRLRSWLFAGRGAVG